MYKPALVAGALAGMAGLLVFLTIHALWITPIWFILPLGATIAGLGGLTTGWAFSEIQTSLPSRPWTTFAVAALIAVILAPAMILAELRPPLFDVRAGVATLAVSPSIAVLRFVLELLGTAMLAGALAGWWLGRTRRAALAVGLAGFVFALGPGHNIPFIGATPGVAKELVIMGSIIIVSSLTLVEGHALLNRVAGSGRSQPSEEGPVSPLSIAKSKEKLL